VIKKYFIASFCVLAYFHLLPLILQNGPVNSAAWDLFVFLIYIPFLPGAVVGIIIVPGVLHGTPIGIAGVIANDIFYIGMIWVVFHFKKKKSGMVITSRGPDGEADSR